MKYLAPDIGHTTQVDLEAGVEIDSYSMSMVSEDNQVVGYFHEMPYPRKDEVEDMQVDSRIIYLATPFTLVPASEFKPELTERIAWEAFTFDQIDFVYHFVSGDIAGVYLIPQALKDVLEENFTGFRPRHVVESLLKKHSSDSLGVLAHWTKEGLILLAFRDGLQLANYYALQSPEDAVYYVLSAYQHIGQDPLEHPLYMSGRIADDGVLFDKLSGFVRSFVWCGDMKNLPTDFPFEPHLLYHLTP